MFCTWRDLFQNQERRHRILKDAPNLHSNDQNSVHLFIFRNSIDQQTNFGGLHLGSKKGFENSKFGRNRPVHNRKGSGWQFCPRMEFQTHSYLSVCYLDNYTVSLVFKSCQCILFVPKTNSNRLDPLLLWLVRWDKLECSKREGRKAQLLLVCPK